MFACSRKGKPTVVDPLARVPRINVVRLAPDTAMSKKLLMKKVLPISLCLTLNAKLVRFCPACGYTCTIACLYGSSVAEPSSTRFMAEPPNVRETLNVLAVESITKYGVLALIPVVVTML
jgi:hypothetical protein